MSIHIIKQGTRPSNLFKGTCFSCDTQIECLREDGLIIAHSEGEIVLVECPVCESTLNAYPATVQYLKG